MPPSSLNGKEKPSPAEDGRLFNPRAWAEANPRLHVEYSSDLGCAVVARSEKLLRSVPGRALKGKVQLVFTSPPFPLNRKKRYGNLEGDAFKKWLAEYARLLRRLLTPDASIVIEMGNAWEPGLPVMSTLAMEALMEFKNAAKLNLCQEFIWFNKAKLPTPAQWVTVNRWRAKDAFTRLWWLSPTPYPKADTRRVLTPYSGSMKTLIRTQKYNSGTRPSQHVINPTSFLKDNGGAIPPNVLTVGDEDAELPTDILVGANTNSGDAYSKFCKARGLEMHPARMPVSLAKFFVNLCTDEGDLVLDPFGGSNTTGAAAEELKRKWVSIEANAAYAKSGIGRFPELTAKLPAVEAIPPDIREEVTVDG